MEIRNPVYNAFGTIDCEINHPVYGWIPFTASPDDRPDIFEAALAMGPAPYVAPPPPPPPTIEEQRASMICSPAQMRLALHRMGLLAQVQAIADSDPEASIVWEYATQIIRTSPLIEALSADFTPEEIDDIFRAAMAVQT